MLLSESKKEKKICSTPSLLNSKACDTSNFFVVLVMPFPFPFEFSLFVTLVFPDLKGINGLRFGTFDEGKIDVFRK